MLGYSDPYSGILSLLGYKSKASLLLSGVGGALLALSAFIEKWIYDDPIAITVLGFTVLLDWIIGTIAGFKREGWSTSKFFRTPATFMLYLIICANFNIFLGSPAALGLMGAMAINTVFSIITNAAYLNIIKGDLKHKISSLIDTHKFSPPNETPTKKIPN